VLLQGFYRGIWSVGVVHIPIGVGNISSDARATGTTCGRCNTGGVAVHRAPEAGPFKAIGPSSSSYFERALAVPPQDGG
jgi:hypothetical protein